MLSLLRATSRYQLADIVVAVEAGLWFDSSLKRTMGFGESSKGPGSEQL